MSEEKIYPSMVIRSQAEAIELLQQENQQLKERCEKYCEQYQTVCDELTSEKMDLKQVLDEIREYINTTEVSDDIGGILILKECMYFDEILQILDKVKE